MDDLQLRCTSASRGNHVRFEVEAGDRDPEELRESGMPGFGSAEFVFPSEEDAQEFEAGKVYNFSLTQAAHEA